MKDKLDNAHKHSKNNREEIMRSKFCGCFYCCRTFGANPIKEWVDRGADTALCPYCGIDSVIGDASGLKLDKPFLLEMKEFWFSVGRKALTNLSS